MNNKYLLTLLRFQENEDSPIILGDLRSVFKQGTSLLPNLIQIEREKKTVKFSSLNSAPVKSDLQRAQEYLISVVKLT